MGNENLLLTFLVTGNGHFREIASYRDSSFAFSACFREEAAVVELPNHGRRDGGLDSTRLGNYYYGVNTHSCNDICDR